MSKGEDIFHLKVIHCFTYRKSFIETKKVDGELQKATLTISKQQTDSAMNIH